MYNIVYIYNTHDMVIIDKSNECICHLCVIKIPILYPIVL